MKQLGFLCSIGYSALGMSLDSRLYSTLLSQRSSYKQQMETSRLLNLTGTMVHFLVENYSVTTSVLSWKWTSKMSFHT